MVLKSKLIKFYGGGDKAKAALFLCISQQRIDKWPDVLTHKQCDGIIASLVRQNKSVPGWLFK